MQYDATAMSPASNSCNFDHSYELPLRRNLLLLLLDLLRFVAGVLLDRVGFSSSCLGELQLPGQPWGGEHDDDDAALERFLEARLWWEAGMRSPSLTAPGYRRRVVALPGDDKLGAEDDGGGAAVCAICLVGLEAGGCQTVAELCGCSHAFHAACIDAWAAGSGEATTTCPLCRAPMLPTAFVGRAEVVPRSL